MLRVLAFDPVRNSRRLPIPKAVRFLLPHAMAGLLAIALLAPRAEAQASCVLTSTQPAVVGQWAGPFDYTFRINQGVQCVAYDEFSHAALIPTGMYRGWVLLWRYNVDASCTPLLTTETWLFNPADPSNLVRVGYILPLDVFCAGMAFDFRGSMVVSGGSGGIPNQTWTFVSSALGAVKDDGQGDPHIPATDNPWLGPLTMKIPRYYPTLVGLNRRSLSGITCAASPGRSILGVGGPPAASAEGNEFWEYVTLPATPCALVPASISAAHLPYATGNLETYALEPQGNPPETLFDAYPRAFQTTVADAIFVANDVDADQSMPSMTNPANTPGSSWVIQPPRASHPEWRLYRGPQAGATGAGSPTYERQYGTAVRYHRKGPLTTGKDEMYVFGGGEDSNYYGTVPPGQASIRIAHSSVQELKKDATFGATDPLATGNWIQKAPMNCQRVFANSILIPTGEVFLEGGTNNWSVYAPVDFPELYTPGTAGVPGTGSSMCVVPPNPHPDIQAQMPPPPVTFPPRFYHHIGILLPDGRVLVGGGEERFPTILSTHSKYTFEIYSPPYLFQGIRPVVLDAPSQVTFNQTDVFKVEAMVEAGSTIDGVVLLRPGAVTHHFDTDQVLIELDVTSSGSGTTRDLYCTAPDERLGPAGWYMLFVIEKKTGTNYRIPSMAHFVHLR